MTELCKCGKNQAEPPHTCPFSEDVHKDYEAECTCCEACQLECLWDI